MFLLLGWQGLIFTRTNLETNLHDSLLFARRFHSRYTTPLFSSGIPRGAQEKKYFMFAFKKCLAVNAKPGQPGRGSLKSAAFVLRVDLGNMAFAEPRYSRQCHANWELWQAGENLGAPGGEKWRTPARKSE